MQHSAALDGRVWLRPNSDFHERPSLEIGDPSAKVGCHVPFDRGCPSWVRAEPLGGLGNLVFGGRGEREKETSYKTGMTRNKHVKQKSPAIAQKQSTILRSLMPKKENHWTTLPAPTK